MAVEERSAAHPEVGELAAFIDGALSDTDRSRVEAHLAGCAECRSEVAAVSRLVRRAPQRRRVAVGLAAAAVLALLLVPAVRGPIRFGSSERREPAVTSTAAPVAIAPRGAVESARALVWTAVPRAARYRVVLMDSAGTVVWRWEATDTSAALPDSVRLRSGSPYFWKVEAETGFDRWVASDLVDFTARTHR